MKKLLLIISSLCIHWLSITGDVKQLDGPILQAACKHSLQQNKEYLATKHKPLIILFSACAGMGKTTVAKALQKELKLVKFDAWDIRIFLRERGYFSKNMSDEEKISCFLGCFQEFACHINKEPNKAILFDESIDREKPSPSIYDRVLKIAQKLGYSTFVIQLQVSKEVSFERMKQRERGDACTLKHLEKRFEGYYQDHRNFPTKKVNYRLFNEVHNPDPSKIIDPCLLKKLNHRIQIKEDEQ